MKTSNKILIGLLVVIFAMPAILAAALKSKIDKGEYTQVKSTAQRAPALVRSGSFTSFSVVKVEAPDADMLRCHLKLSDDMSFKYNKQDEHDSVSVYTANDTLYIRYVPNKPAGTTGPIDQNNLSVRVSLPRITDLVIDGSTVIIDSLPSQPAKMSVTLKNNGVIKDGTEHGEDETAGVQQKATPNTLDLAKQKNTEAPVIPSNPSQVKVLQAARVQPAPEQDIQRLPIFKIL